MGSNKKGQEVPLSSRAYNKVELESYFSKRSYTQEPLGGSEKQIPAKVPKKDPIVV